MGSVRTDDLPQLHRFVRGLETDRDAVRRLTLTYSSGAVEGHDNPNKMLKRQMDGRAGFDLLRKRILLGYLRIRESSRKVGQNQFSRAVDTGRRV